MKDGLTERESPQISIMKTDPNAKTEKLGPFYFIFYA